MDHSYPQHSATDCGVTNPCERKQWQNLSLVTIALFMRSSKRDEQKRSSILSIQHVPREIQTQEKLLRFSSQSVTFAAGGIGEISAAASLLHSFSRTVGTGSDVGPCGSTCSWTQVPLTRTGALRVWNLLAPIFGHREHVGT